MARLGAGQRVVAARPGAGRLSKEPPPVGAGAVHGPALPEEGQVEVEAVEPGDRLGRELDVLDRAALEVVVGLLAEVSPAVPGLAPGRVLWYSRHC
jgi:hypothetical protein